MSATFAELEAKVLTLAPAQRERMAIDLYRSVHADDADDDTVRETLELLSQPGFRDGFERAAREAETGDTLTFEDVFGEKP